MRIDIVKKKGVSITNVSVKVRSKDVIKITIE